MVENLSNVMIFEGHDVEVFEWNGRVLFNPYHVGNCLELGESSIRMAIGKMNNKQIVKLKNSDVKLIDFRKLNNAGENFLTESGVYKLIFRSNKPDAEKFQDWITDEVLPQIRKTGGYIPIKEEDSDELIMAKGMQIAMATIQKKNELIEIQNKRLEEMKPKAEQFDLYIDCIGTLSWNQSSKALYTGRNKLMEYLRDKGVLNLDNTPNTYCSERNYFEVKTFSYKNGINTYQTAITRITPKGQDFLYRYLKKNIAEYIEYDHNFVLLDKLTVDKLTAEKLEENKVNASKEVVA